MRTTCCATSNRASRACSAVAKPGGDARRGSGRRGPPAQLSLAQASRPEGADSEIAGLVERVTFHEPESGFSVLRVRVPGESELVTVVGSAPGVSAGEGIRAEGRFERDPKWGLQLRAREIAIAPPVTREGIEKYLASGAVHGIGPELAKRLVAAFGERVFDVVERAPAQLREVEGVGAVRAESIARAIRSQREVRELMSFLHSHGVGTARAVRIHRRYGARAIALIREDPYRLARDVRGIGFATADALALRLGIDKGARIRLRAGLHCALDDAAASGHCALPESELLDAACELLACAREPLARALEAEVASESLVRDSIGGAPSIFPPRLHRAEREAAARLRRLRDAAPPWPRIDAERAVAWAQKELAVELSPSQREAVGALLGAKLGVLTGGPGVGKTTLVRTLLAILREKGARIELAAPTGRAARRLAEATGQPARTLHRLLEVDPQRAIDGAHGGFKRNVDSPLDCDLVVVDEASMLDIQLFAALLRALPVHAALWLVGDADQLPSVGPGRVLGDAIESRVAVCVELREVFRQAAESGIVRAAHAIHEGRSPIAPNEAASDFYFVEANDPERAAERVLAVVCERIPKRFGLDARRDVQVLVPMHRGPLGTQRLNRALQRALDPTDGASPRIEHGEVAFAQDDRVMQTENDYDKDVFNGDLGVVASVDVEARALEVRFDGHAEPVRYERGELDALALAYAITVHKAQGSEYPAVVIALASQHFRMLDRRLVYTAVTRGRKLVVIVGQRRALELAIERGASAPRHTKLREWLAQPA